MSITPRAVKRTGMGAVVVILAALALLALTKRQSPLSGAWVDQSDPLFRVVLLVDESGKVVGSGGYLNELRRSTSFDITGQASEGDAGLRFGGSSFTGSLRDGKLIGVLYNPTRLPIR